MDDNCEFQVGLVLAGAISAGAYSSGVIDFIIEALDAYYEAKDSPGWTGPTHDVRIPVMAGASAGGMTSSIAALHAFHEIEHIWPDKPVPPKPANRLYSSWVSDISIEGLLEITDLADGRDKDGVKSALCCDVLTRILGDAFDQKGPLRVRPWIGRGDNRSLRVLLTVTNLRGVPYSFAVSGANKGERFGMLNHGDYFDFTIAIDPKPESGSHPLKIVETSGREWDLFRSTALATGAFPIGLAPRGLERSPVDYLNAVRVVVDGIGGFKPIRPDASILDQEPYNFIAVDGGAIDNEPLELARRNLAGVAEHNPRDGQIANKAVVLVAPFPNFAHTPGFDKDDRLIHIIPHLASTLIEQARFKPDELAKAADEEIFSRFVISPIRPAKENTPAKKYPIASAVLNGFGGFLHESFRRHDYLLGRRNAQAFLRWHFALPATNPLFEKFRGARDHWYVQNPPAAEGAAGSVAGTKMYSRTVGGPQDTPGLPIIPLVPQLQVPIEIRASDLPKPGNISLADLESRIRRRAETVVTALIDVDLREITDGMVFGSALRYAARRYGTEMLTKKAWQIVKRAIDDVEAAFAAE
jgi:hypothetical protein